MTHALLFRIDRIETKQFACFPEAFNNKEDVDISAQFAFDVNQQLHHIRCFCKFTYEQGGHPLLVSEFATHFSINPASLSTVYQDNQYVIPVDHLRHFATIAVGTARGILWAKTEGTCLNQIVLPPINLVEAIKDDFRIEKLSSQKVAES